MEDKKTFGEFVTQKRKEVGLTQKSFAEKLFVTESAVSKWERGISYPDIALIRDICEVLQITEHELLTASEDLEIRNTERLARKYRNVSKGYKYTLLFMFGISLLTCFICNIAVQHKLSWFFIVLTAEMIAFSLTLVPVLVTEHRGLSTLGAFFTSIVLLLMTCDIYSHGDWFFVAFISVLFGMSVIFLPIVLNGIGLPEFLSNKKALLCLAVDSALLLLLLFVCNIYSGGDWFLNTALPITVFSMIVPWSMMLIIRYCPINNLLKTAGCFAVMAVFDYFIQAFINMVLGKKPYGLGFKCNFGNWSEKYINENVNMIVFLSLFSIAVLFAIAGIIKTIQKHSQRDLSA